MDDGTQLRARLRPARRCLSALFDAVSGWSRTGKPAAEVYAVLRPSCRRLRLLRPVLYAILVRKYFTVCGVPVEFAASAQPGILRLKAPAGFRLRNRRTSSDWEWRPRHPCHAEERDRFDRRYAGRRDGPPSGH